MPTAVISSRNAAVKAARKLVRRHARDQSGEFLVEGPGVVEGLHVLTRMFVTAEADPAIVHDALARGVDIVEVDESVMREVADTATARGIVAVARFPRPSLEEAIRATTVGGRGTGRVLVADGVADPGNAGTLIRTADAAGFDAVVLTTGSVDPRNPKTVRATAGSVFHLPVVDRVEPSDLVTACAGARLRLVGAVANAGRRHDGAELGGGCAVVLGNETRGLSPVLAGALDEVVAIPMLRAPRRGYQGVAESLNLAASAAVLMYESVRQRGAGLIDHDPPRLGPDVRMRENET
jgi:TrmH family RNA methyltransferase